MTHDGAVPRGVGLTRERIVDAALAFVDREGVDALTVRRLAAELGVGTMTLYGYFRTKSELLDSLADAAVEEIEQPDPSLAWDERLRHCMVDLCEVLIRHPSVVPLLTSRPPRSPTVRKGMELAMDCLREGGFDEQDALRAYLSLLAYVFGFAGFAAGSATGQSDGGTSFIEDQFTYGLDGLLVGLGASRTRRSSSRTRPGRAKMGRTV